MTDHDTHREGLAEAHQAISDLAALTTGSTTCHEVPRSLWQCGTPGHQRGHHPTVEDQLRDELDRRFPVTCEIKPGRITAELAAITDPAERAAEVTRRLRNLIPPGSWYPEGLH